MDRGRSVKEDRILHKILNARALNLLQEVPARLLPCSEVDLRNMSSHGPEEGSSVVNNMKRKFVKQNKVSVLLAVKLQLVFDGAVNDPDEVDVPAEKEHQESLPL